jgi:peptidylprolyl isomerase
MKALLPLAALALIAAAPTPTDIEASAPPTAWIAVAPENLAVFTTPKGKFVMQLAPEFAPAHVAAIKALVRAGAFAGGAVVRVQDNYVVQFAAAEGKAKDAAAIAKTPPGPLPPEYERPLAGLVFTPLPGPDAYADAAGFVNGLPAAIDKTAKTVWLQHCYGMVGIGRGNAPDSGDGSELYAVIGHAPRHLDRNMAMAGRIVSGIEGLSSLPRGTEALGFYKTPGEALPVTGATMVSDLPVAQRPRVEVMDTTSPTFAAYAKARANRSDAFFVRPAGAVDACNVRVPVRVTGAQ